MSSRLSRLGVTVMLVLGLTLTSAACGMNVQTLNPYTPAEGVNFDVGAVNLRNVMILSRTEGEGYLSATMTANETDSLVSVTGTAMKADGSEGAPLAVTLAAPIQVPAGGLVVLTDRPLIEVKSADLESGLVAKLVLTFREAGEVTTNAPVIDATQPAYATITPSAAPSATPSS